MPKELRQRTLWREFSVSIFYPDVALGLPAELEADLVEISVAPYSPSSRDLYSVLLKVYEMKRGLEIKGIQKAFLKYAGLFHRAHLYFASLALLRDGSQKRSIRSMSSISPTFLHPSLREQSWEQSVQIKMALAECVLSEWNNLLNILMFFGNYDSLKLLSEWMDPVISRIPEVCEDPSVISVNSPEKALQEVLGLPLRSVFEAKVKALTCLLRGLILEDEAASAERIFSECCKTLVQGASGGQDSPKDISRKCFSRFRILIPTLKVEGIRKAVSSSLIAFLKTFSEKSSKKVEVTLYTTEYSRDDGEVVLNYLSQELDCNFYDLTLCPWESTKLAQKFVEGASSDDALIIVAETPKPLIIEIAENILHANVSECYLYVCLPRIEVDPIFLTDPRLHEDPRAKHCVATMSIIKVM